VHSDAVPICTETFSILQEILRAKSDAGASLRLGRRPMVLPYKRERRLEANHIYFCGHSLHHQLTDVGLTTGNDLLQPRTIPVFFRQIHTTTASHPLPQDRHPTTFSVIVGPSNPSNHQFRGIVRLEGGRAIALTWATLVPAGRMIDDEGMTLYGKDFCRRNPALLGTGDSRPYFTESSSRHPQGLGQVIGRGSSGNQGAGIRFGTWDLLHDERCF
jgi:hypothetical protein